MASKQLLTFLLACYSAFGLSSANSACTKSPYNNLLFLSAYQPAEDFCSAHYPIPTVTITAAPHRVMRIVRNTQEARAPNTNPTTTCTGACSAWSSCSKVGGGFLSTLCSCIEKTKTVTITPKNNCPAPTGGQCTIKTNADFSGPCCSKAYCGVSPGANAGYCTSLIGDYEKCSSNQQCEEGECYYASKDKYGTYSTCAPPPIES